MNIKKSMTKIAIGLCALGLVVSGCSNKKDVAATVNGVDIPMATYEEEYKSTAKQVVKQYGQDYLKEASMEKGKNMGQMLRENILKNLIQMEILSQDAKANNITVSEDEVNKYLEQTTSLYGGEEAFNKALAEQEISKEFYQQYISRGLLMQKYSQEKMKKIKPTEEELKAYFEKNKDKFQNVSASHILVKTEEEAKNIKAQLDGGADFAQLAKEKSIDTSSGQQGGELGSFGKGQMVKEFEDKAFSMKEGEISDPVKSQFGYHIIKLNKIQNDFESQKEMIKSQYVQEKFREEVEKLEAKSKVKKYADPMEDIKVDFSQVKSDKDTKTQGQENTKAGQEENAKAKGNTGAEKKAQ